MEQQKPTYYVCGNCSEKLTILEEQVRGDCFSCNKEYLEMQAESLREQNREFENGEYEGSGND